VEGSEKEQMEDIKNYGKYWIIFWLFFDPGRCNGTI
jgi:hypothetical protein